MLHDWDLGQKLKVTVAMGKWASDPGFEIGMVAGIVAARRQPGFEQLLDIVSILN